MSGHSQYNNRKRRIEVQGQKLNKVYMKVKKMIMRALKEDSVIALEKITKEAKRMGISAEKIDTIIKIVRNEKDKSNYEDITYEGIGPYGIAVMMSISTDNRNRTAGEIRSIFSKFGCKLGVDGSVAFMFERLGLVIYEKKEDFDVNSFLESVVEEIEIENIDETDDTIKVWCAISNLLKMSEILYGKFGKYLESRIGWRAKDNIVIDNEENINTIYKFIDSLENNNDITNLDLNVDIC